MKNLCLSFALILSIPLFSQTAQTTPVSEGPKEKFSLSAIGGLNITRMPYNNPLQGRGYPVPDIETRHNFFAGLSARQRIDRHWAVLADVAFAGRGFGYVTPLQAVKLRFDYFDFTPQLEFKAHKNLYVSLGGYFSIRLNEHIKVDDGPWITVNPEFGEYGNDTDAGIVPGLSLRFGRVTVLTRYQIGLAKATDLELSDDLGEPLGTVHQHNRSLQIGLGFRIL